MPKFLFNKLVRDKTLERLERFGIRYEHKILADQEYMQALKDKLIEESQEVIDAKNRQEMITELADVAEVVKALQKLYGIEQQEIDAAQAKTDDERGAFEKGIYIESIEMDDDNKWLGYFRKTPEKYKEEK